jgi:hypothetical protein
VWIDDKKAEAEGRISPIRKDDKKVFPSKLKEK